MSMKKLPVEDKEMIIICTRVAISRTFLSIGISTDIPQTHCIRERKPDHNWKLRGQHDSSYYQPQSASYNQPQHYRQDRITQQAPSRNDCDRDKV